MALKVGGIIWGHYLMTFFLKAEGQFVEILSVLMNEWKGQQYM